MNTASTTKSIIRIGLTYDQLLWSAHESTRSFTHSWDDNTVYFENHSVTIDCSIEIPSQIRTKLVKCLAVDREQDIVPIWNSLDLDLTDIVSLIEQEVLAAARYVDSCFRRSSKGVRLPPFQIQKKDLNRAQPFNYMTWIFSDSERKEVEHIFKGFCSAAKSRLNGGLDLPTCNVFDQKQIYLTTDEVSKIFSNFTTEEAPPFWNLYSIAWQTFVSQKQSQDSSVLLLCTAIETCLKWSLIKSSDDIANTLIDKMPSPRLDQLYEICVEKTDFPFPNHFKNWLGQLAQARNFFAHKPRGASLPLLQIVRWFAIGEALLKATIYVESDPLVGSIIKPNDTPKEESGLTKDSQGVVLRRETYYGDSIDKLHALMDMGDSYYVSEDKIEVLPKKQQKFPDIG
ncbi:MAG: hypothetical protein KC471_08630 [Flavobacteriaceae bacterium]|nr:hypothetical protein [Flavobacteriaceae bacterium]